ncbi:MAG: beta-lactamase family protein, partial [Lewinella sp.]|nr:beta-lactamase family protein [Lewinella sp.]
LCMQLVEDGMLNLDDPLTKWLDGDMLAKIENADRATLRQVLNHTSGIADVIEDNNFYLAVLNDPGKFWHPDELLHFVYHDDPEFPLGESVGYSNTNLLLASMVIEAATGRSHAELLRERLLDPLGMEDTYYHWHESLPGQTAQGYFDLYNNGDILNLSNFNTGSGNGYGGMYSTVFDIAHFIDALFRDERILSPATMATMLTYTDEEPGNHRAFGITVNKDFLERSPLEFGLGHRGRDLAYTADAYYFPNQEVTMVYLINYGTDAESGLREVFLDYRTALVDLLMSD